MRTRHSLRLVVVAAVPFAILAAWPTAGVAGASQPRLLTAANYTVMGGSAITNTGPTVITGNLAISPSNASSVTGFPPGIVTGSKDYNNAAAIQAQTDLVTTYNDAAGATPFTDMSGIDLGGKTLTPGTYHFSSSAQLTGTLTLDGQSSTNATFVFQIGSTLTTASASRVVLINGAGACAVFWQVTSSATLGTTTAFQGNLIALTSITMTTGATIGVGGGVNGGRALARNGALTLDTNVITPPPAGCTFVAAPTPSSSPTPTPNTGASSPSYGLWVAASGLLLLLTATYLRRRSE
jgi:LPXTG-motif cell wall-anchored protein